MAHDRGRRHNPLASPRDMFGQLRTLTEQAGREPAEVGIEVWVSMDSWNGSGLGEGDPVLERKPAVRTTNFNRRHHHRIPGRTMGDHLTALRRYHAAVADLL